MVRNKTQQPKTFCGLQMPPRLGGGRAKVIARDGATFTYRWPCGYEQTDVLTQGVGRLKKPASDDTAAFFARYWAQGVTYECPRCRREAIKKAKK